MATAARKPCTWPGCPALVSDGSRCAQHRKQADQQRGSAHQRGYTSAWTKASKAFLSAHPLCQCKECDEGRVRLRASEVVDHTVPHRGDKALFWDRNNWMAMAKVCHDKKTATEDGGFGRRAGGRSKV